MGAMLTMLLLLVACASEDDQGAGQPLRLVNANLTISLPKRIVNIHRITRMSSDIVQANSDENDFRGLSDIHMLCFNQYPTQTSSNLGNMISIKTSGDEVNDTVTEEDYSLCQEISIPVGTCPCRRCSEEPRGAYEVWGDRDCRLGSFFLSGK